LDSIVEEVAGAKFRWETGKAVSFEGGDLAERDDEVLPVDFVVVV
jgi:hypothetical protein